MYVCRCESRGEEESGSGGVREEGFVVWFGNKFNPHTQPSKHRCPGETLCAG